MNGEEIYIRILNSNIINFAIMILTFVWIFKKFKLGKIIDNIAYDIQNNVTSSTQAVQNAILEYKKAKRNSRNKDAIKAEIIENAKDTITKLEQKSFNKIKEKENELEENFAKMKNSAFENKLQKTTEEIKDAVIDLSREIIIKKMTPDIHSKIIEDSLLQLDNIGEIKF